MNDDAVEKALTAAMLQRMQQSDNATEFGLALDKAFTDYTGVAGVPFTILIGMPDATLTRFTNLEPQSSLAMVTEVLRLAVEDAKMKIFTTTITKQ